MTRKPLRHASAIALACATLLALPGAATAQSDISTKVSGFGTLGAMRNNGAGVYRASPTQYRGASGNRLEFGADSRLGVQGDVQFNEIFSATGQMLSTRRHEDFQPRVEWLFGQAKLNDTVSLRAGRMGLPAFMVSDFRFVGYATPWIRGPVEAYSAMPYPTFDGLQGVFRFSLGDANLSVQPSIGKSKARLVTENPSVPGIPIDLHMDTDKLRSVNVKLEYNDWTFRWGTVHTESDVRVDGLLPGLGWTFLQGSVFKDKFSGYGVQYDNGSLLVMAELVTRRSDSIDSDSHYVTAGYRFGNWTPFVTLGGYKDKTANIKTESQTLGLRWDVAKNMSLKTQFDSAEGEPGAFVPMAPTTAKARVVSLALDFVF